MAASLVSINSEKDLIADCTCPVCQELFQHPQKLNSCRHTLCRRCVKKMQQKEPDPMAEMAEISFSLFGMLHQRVKTESAKPGTVCCPICRETSDTFEPDATVEYLVKVLQAMRSFSRCSGDDSCLTEATVQCACCDKRLCQSHYTAQLNALKDSGVALLKDLDVLLAVPDEANSESLQQLQSAVEASAAFEAELIDCIRQGFSNFRRQVQQCEAKLRSPLIEDEAERNALWLDRAALRQLAANGCWPPSGSLARMLPEAQRRVKSAQLKWPDRQLALQFQPDKLKDQLAGLLVQHASSDTFQSRYSQLPSLVTRVRQQNLTQKPWDICLLSNLDGVVNLNGVLKFRSSLSSSDLSSVKELTGPLLVINAQNFPTKMLHVTDMEVKQVATISPRFGLEGMPGRMHVHNDRQLILTSDAGRHRVSVFNLEGRLIRSFGEKGSAPGQFHSPLGVGAVDNQMFVVDAKNRRVQVFDIDNDYNCLAIIPHDGFTEGLQSVLVTQSSVFVADRDKSRLSIFDRGTRQPTIAQPLKLEGQPFGVAADEYGNAMVTLVKDAKLLVVNRFGSVLKTLSFKETVDESSRRQVPSLEDLPFPMLMPMLQMSNGALPRLFHGAAFEPKSRRLFIADLMRSCILMSDF